VKIFRFSMLAALIMAFALLVSSPQLRADSYQDNHGSLKFDHLNFDDANTHPSFFYFSDNSDKDKKDNGNGFGFGDGNGDHHDFDGNSFQVATPEPAVFSLLFAGLVGLFGLITLKKANA
jgi:hypothetical protein